VAPRSTPGRPQGPPRAFPRIGLALVLLGLGLLLWTAVVWAWRDPFTSAYTTLQQHRLERQYEELLAKRQPAGDVAAAARRFRLASYPGDPIGRIRIRRLRLDMVLVEGTDEESLRKGPGRDRRSFMPGEGKLVYIAGHRTTYLAPFADIDRLRPGDRIELELPYGDFTYEVNGHRIVDDQDLSVLRSSGRETLRLQACHPRFFATHRYVVSAHLVATGPPATATASARGA
jgi:sortase A